LLVLAVVLGLVLPVARFASRAHLSNQSLRTRADEQDQNRAELRKGAPESCEIAEAMHRLRVRAQPLPLSFDTASPLSLRSLLALTSPHFSRVKPRLSRRTTKHAWDMLKVEVSKMSTAHMELAHEMKESVLFNVNTFR
jgi:hypothetical protein